jgi:hypothetical protein
MAPSDVWRTGTGRGCLSATFKRICGVSGAVAKGRFRQLPFLGYGLPAEILLRPGGYASRPAQPSCVPARG